MSKQVLIRVSEQSSKVKLQAKQETADAVAQATEMRVLAIYYPKLAGTPCKTAILCVRNLQAYGMLLQESSLAVAKSRRSTVRKGFVHGNGLVVKLRKVGRPGLLDYSTSSTCRRG